MYFKNSLVRQILLLLIDRSAKMGNPPEYKSLTNQLVTDIPADLNSSIYKELKNKIQKFQDEAIYVYSFKENKMLYAEGWEPLLGYPDHEITMLKIVSITAPEYAPFSNDINDKALMFLQTIHNNLEAYSFTIEIKKIHKKGHEVPLISRVGIYKAEKGKVSEIIGRSQIANGVHFGKVMRYATYGPEKSTFEEELNKALFKHFAISDKEKEALALVAKGLSFKEIAGHLKVSSSAIEKRIIPMYRRFNVRSLAHLISFAYENHILPVIFPLTLIF